MTIAYVSAAEAKSVGVGYGDVNWGPPLVDLFVEKGIKHSRLVQGKLIAGCWDMKGGLWLDDQRAGGIHLMPFSPQEVEQWLEEVDT